MPCAVCRAPCANGVASLLATGLEWLEFVVEQAVTIGLVLVHERDHAVFPGLRGRRTVVDPDFHRHVTIRPGAPGTGHAASGPGWHVCDLAIRRLAEAHVHPAPLGEYAGHLVLLEIVLDELQPLDVLEERLVLRRIRIGVARTPEGVLKP